MPKPSLLDIVSSKSSLIWEKTWPILITLLTPFLFVGRVILTLVFRVYMRVFRNPKISQQEKCPGCGIEKTHKIEYSAAIERILHTCGLCGAVWPSMPVRPADRWRIAPEQLPMPQEARTALAEIGNIPILRNSPDEDEEEIKVNGKAIEVTTRIVQ